MDAILVDTNVLVYPYDPRDQAKQARAEEVLDRVIESGRAVVSVQCLTEFYSVVTRRLPEPLAPAEALAQVQLLARACRVLDLTAMVVLEGCRGAVEHNLSLWDGLIWAAARLNQVSYVLTEDAAHNKYLEGVRYLNPFAPDFAL